MPCPRCGSYNVEFTDCGYSSFNVAQAKCECGHKISVDGDDARQAWNAYSGNPKARLFLHWLASRRMGQRPEKIVDAAAAIFGGNAMNCIPW